MVDRTVYLDSLLEDLTTALQIVRRAGGADDRQRAVDLEKALYGAHDRLMADLAAVKRAGGDTLENSEAFLAFNRVRNAIMSFLTEVYRKIIKDGD